MKVKCKQQFEVQLYGIGIISKEQVTIIPDTIWEIDNDEADNGNVKLVLHKALELFQIKIEKEKFEQYFEKYEYAL